MCKVYLNQIYTTLICNNTYISLQNNWVLIKFQRKWRKIWTEFKLKVRSNSDIFCLYLLSDVLKPSSSVFCLYLLPLTFIDPAPKYTRAWIVIFGHVGEASSSSWQYICEKLFKVKNYILCYLKRHLDK